MRHLLFPLLLLLSAACDELAPYSEADFYADTDPG